MRALVLSFLLGLLWHLAALPCARAQSLPFDPSQFSDPSQLISDSVALEVIRLAGIAADHRAYRPATPLGISPGFEFGIELTLIKVPKSFGDTLSAAGLGSAGNIPVAPMPRAHLAKGLGERVEVGLSYIKYKIYRIYGGDIKIAVTDPASEGLTWAIRLAYATASLGFVKSKTLTPQILASKRMAFADPYFGFGYQRISGEINVTTSDLIDGAPVSIPLPTKKASAWSFLAFMGVGFKIPQTGIKIGLEGAYSLKGYNQIGALVGLSF